MAALTRDAIDLSALQGTAPADGALCLFVGVVRDHHQGRRVLRLEYEAYEEMALPLMQRIEDEARRRWPVSAVRIVHRLGALEVGEASVAVAVLSAHREEAFAACRWAIDTLKATVPIWKKEYGEDGAVWMEGPGTCSPDPAALERPGRSPDETCRGQAPDETCRGQAPDETCRGQAPDEACRGQAPDGSGRGQA